jgi:5'-nucleotidase
MPATNRGVTMNKTCLVFLLTLLSAVSCNDAGPAVAADADSLTLVHLNDTYRIDAVEEGRRGGFARVVTVVHDLQQQGQEVILTHGGDFLYPSLESQLWHGEQMIEAMNYLHDVAPLYAVPGNHEFDPRQADALVAAVRQSRFSWVGDNMTFATGETDVDKALQHTLVLDRAGRRIGIVALTLLPEDGGNDRDYAPVTGSYLDTAERVLEALQEQDVDAIIGITHLHLADDRKLAALRARYPKFVLIVGGHEHEPEFEPGDAGHAAIAKGASNARVIWRVDIGFDSELPTIDASPINLDESIAQNADYQRIADKWRERLLAKFPFLPSTVGYAAVPLDAREVTIRNGESGWGNFIADQMRLAFAEPVAEFAFINSGSLRLDDYVAEDITFEDIARTFAFSSYLRRMTIGGGEFRELLEAGYRGEGPSKGYFPQVSGIRVCVDRSQPDGDRIAQLQLPGGSGWQDIEPDTDYTLVAPEYLFRGGDGYDFSRARDVSPPASELKYLVLDGVIRAQALGEEVGAPVDTQNPRIAFAPTTGEPCFATPSG